MPISTKHRDYENYCSDWELVDDCAQGARRVKERNETYLPGLSWKTDYLKKYNIYKTRAVFEEATGRTWEALLGLVFSTPPKIEFPETQEDLLDDVSLDGCDFTVFARRVFGEVLAPGRCGVLVDVPEYGGDRPYAQVYHAKQIINWKCERINGAERLAWIVLEEEVELPDDGDRFSVKPAKQWRLIDVSSGQVEQLLFREAASGPPIVVSATVPVRAGVPLDRIPFVFFNATHNRADVDDLPLYGLATLNLAAYRNSADLENGRHFVGCPTPYIFGVDVEQVFEIGSSQAWVSSNPDAKAGYVEFMGQGLSSLERAIEEKRTQMAAQGARLLLPPKTFPETESKMRLEKAAEHSALSSMATVVSEGLETVLAYMLWWSDRTLMTIDDAYELIEVDLRSTFDERPMTPQDAEALMRVWQGGPVGHGMSRSSYLWNLAQGNLLPPGRTAEEEAQLIDQEAPVMPVSADFMPSRMLDRQSERDKQAVSEPDGGAKE